MELTFSGCFIFRLKKERAVIYFLRKYEWYTFCYDALKRSYMFFIVSRFFVHRFYNGITLWPFIIMRDKSLKEDTVFVNHEKIHLRQQIELLVLPFYIWYLGEFIVRLFQYRNWNVAYRTISFEREAYTNEKDLNYLKKRPFLNVRKFF